MAIVFTLLLLTSFVLLIIGLINPKKAFFWRKREQETRKKAALFYTYAFLFCFIGLIITLPDHTEIEAKAAATESERNYELARSCDTNYRFIKDGNKHVHQKGYFVSYINKLGKHWFKKPWMMPTYKQIGPSAFETDESRKLAVFQPVEVISTLYGRSGDFDNYFLVVVPAGSSERFIISDNDFTLKDVRACTLLQKAKNGFPAIAEYIPPSNTDDRPIDDRDRSWINVPAGAIIFINEYNKTDNTIFAEIYLPDGSMKIPYARFKPETLMEINK